MMTWFDAIFELCALVSTEETIQDILDTAIEENMLGPVEAGQIAHALDWTEWLDSNGNYVLSTER